MVLLVKLAKEQLRVRCLNHHYLRHRTNEFYRPIRVIFRYNKETNNYSQELKEIKLS